MVVWFYNTTFVNPNCVIESLDKIQSWKFIIVTIGGKILIDNYVI